MNWKKIVTMPLLGSALGILLMFLFDYFGAGSWGFAFAVVQIPGLYFLLGIALALSSLKINWWLRGIILGPIFSLPSSIVFILFEFGEFGILVIILWAFLFIISGGIIGFILEAVAKLLRC